MAINKIKMEFCKLYYSLKGFSKIHLGRNHKFKIDDYSGSFKNIIYTHIKNNDFMVQMEAMEPTTGVIFFETRKETVPYWVLGILDLRNLTKRDFDTIINKEEII